MRNQIEQTSNIHLTRVTGSGAQLLCKYAMHSDDDLPSPEQTEFTSEQKKLKRRT
jgi:hypothetical protein